MRRLHKRGAYGAQDPHITHNYASGDQQRGNGVQQEILRGENPMDHPDNHIQDTTRERGNLRGAQRGSRQDAAANDGVVSLDLGIYMASGG